MKKYRKRRWKIFINDSGKRWNCIVRADSFNDAIKLARELFSNVNVTGAQRC